MTGWRLGWICGDERNPQRAPAAWLRDDVRFDDFAEAALAAGPLKPQSRALRFADFS